MANDSSTEKLYRKYNLVEARSKPTSKEPRVHQQKAISDLLTWYKADNQPHAGKLLVIPTGGGKTYTAVRFLATGPLSEGYKVLWLAHTHHLLNQAYYSFRDGLGEIREPSDWLKVRAVSGTQRYFSSAEIEPDDDVIIATLQTITKAYKKERAQLRAWLDSTDGKLAVVFDEAHHAPANTYRRLLQGLIDELPGIYLLGLTATPTYTDEKKRGWLTKLFPQDTCEPATANKLMAEGILARPRSLDVGTDISPELNEREYRMLLHSNRDLPDSVINNLAENQTRNNFIVNHYLENREKYGKTLVFADRKEQCEYLSTKLKERGIAAESVYSRVGGGPLTYEGRMLRPLEHNAQAIEDFKDGKLDVLVNIRMLTEGTDVPDAETVFCTRQTTSRILLRQMVGRALRGPQFGGTDEANLVFFIDDWKQLIDFAEWGELETGLAEEGYTELGKRPPLRLISIDLIRRLAEQMSNELGVAPEPFLEFLPLGWYVVKYEQATEDDNTLPVQKMIMVFESEAGSYQRVLELLEEGYLSRLEDTTQGIEAFSETIEELRELCFDEPAEHVGGIGKLDQDIFDLAAHREQQDEPPRFYLFEARRKHNLDTIARRAIDEDWGSRTMRNHLLRLYNDNNYYFNILYPSLSQLHHQFDLVKNRLLEADEVGADDDYEPAVIESSQPRLREAPPELKKQVKDRDGRICVCCGYTRSLQVDHIQPVIDGGGHEIDNLQTLCKVCNGLKGELYIDFGENNPPVKTPTRSLPNVRLPGKYLEDPAAGWERYLRRVFNIFYRCGAVRVVKLHKTPGATLYTDWIVELFEGNEPAWLEPFGGELLERINAHRRETGEAPLTSLTLTTPSATKVLSP
ncbi:MAG: DEAD/DEAH box helicase [Candidatus Coatesbacteria bacterium]|nr:DEAD/DEAH box helicase [Candidatus Coatesbacteria bacterium]